VVHTTEGATARIVTGQTYCITVFLTCCKMSHLFLALLFYISKTAKSYLSSQKFDLTRELNPSPWSQPYFSTKFLILRLKVGW
jgi:hypothetical protein